ncbi:hypothetical protein [Demequina sp. NBRC 110057]|uniref:hypothetical protein n=1 Tax=Demequina sp. NBRC 110057 TaxID=1570346 RepID=UPI0011786F8C|nr:hypothetical protein [Demequina sp. NBRC 110057]
MLELRANLRRLITVGASLVAAVLLATSAAQPASAASDVKYASLGARLSSTQSYVGKDNNGRTYSFVVTANLSSNTSKSVYLKSVRVCFSGAAGSAMYVSPQIRNTTKSIWNATGYKQFTITRHSVGKTVCQSWTVNKSIQKPSNNSWDVFRVSWLNPDANSTGALAPIFAWKK